MNWHLDWIGDNQPLSIFHANSILENPFVKAAGKKPCKFQRPGTAIFKRGAFSGCDPAGKPCILRTP